jgi:L-lactate dehydrogenase complex protein LldE
MKVALFIPCYVDQFYPQVAIATLELLEKLGCEVDFPLEQTCCGQPMANSGFNNLAKNCDKNFIANFSGYDYIVSPSGSCVLHIKEHNPVQGSQIFELSEFLTDVLKVEKLQASFPHKVGLHIGCHGQRGLHVSQMSEIMGADFSKPVQLLTMVQGLALVTLNRKDECCGFGGTFCVSEEAVSVKMGQDRLKDHLSQGVEYITGADVSCLMHLEGILNREKKAVKVIHLAEILNCI